MQEKRGSREVASVSLFLLRQGSGFSRINNGERKMLSVQHQYLKRFIYNKENMEGKETKFLALLHNIYSLYLIKRNIGYVFILAEMHITKRTDLIYLFNTKTFSGQQNLYLLCSHHTFSRPTKLSKNVLICIGKDIFDEYWIIGEM